MNEFFVAILAAFALYVFKVRDTRHRVMLLGSMLSRYQIEKLMETLMDSYLRAAGERDPQRSASIWAMLHGTEEQLCSQFAQFTADCARLESAATRVCTLPLALPYATQWWPQASFDLREAFRIHATGMAEVMANSAGRSERDRAFMMTAELLLMQHTCHWFCKSRNVASVRLMVRHQTAYEQVLAAVSPNTRSAYAQLTGI